MWPWLKLALVGQISGWGLMRFLAKTIRGWQALAKTIPDWHYFWRLVNVYTYSYFRVGGELLLNASRTVLHVWYSCRFFTDGQVFPLGLSFV